MSTFDGIVHEVPDIRIDYFRPRADRKPPLACFLSHVHSDHLAGLESYRSPFIYCSAATREILLRLERYPCRMNFARGILEKRLQTYKHLRTLLKPIPLDTPTVLELEPGNLLSVTLLDANHCPGAVMFLIEADGKAVLYTGDIRSEPWWVTSLVRNPCVIEYTSGIRTLDRIYLDTSVLEDFDLQSKFEGLRELLKRVVAYPDDTVFYVLAFTYGYEEVWTALSKALKSKVHVDRYKMGVYKSLSGKASDDRFAAQTHFSKEAPSLTGFLCANKQHDGCLTLEEDVRIHSCEKGTGCSVMRNKPVVWIQPVVAWLPGGKYVLEVGTGGGGDDFNRDIELQYITPDDLSPLTELLHEKVGASAKLRQEVDRILAKSLKSGRNISITLDESSSDMAEPSLEALVRAIIQKAESVTGENNDKVLWQGKPTTLPSRIRFPYARHSSLPELRNLVNAFTPKDVWPCTVDPISWYECGINMRSLFGENCSGTRFEHDTIMDKLFEERRQFDEERKRRGDTESQDSVESIYHDPLLRSSQDLPSNHSSGSEQQSTPKAGQPQETTENTKRSIDNLLREGSESAPELEGDSQASPSAYGAASIRRRAFKRAKENASGDNWAEFSLISTTDNHSIIEPDLGCK